MSLSSIENRWGVHAGFDRLGDKVAVALSHGKDSTLSQITAGVGMQAMAALALAYQLLAISLKLPMAVGRGALSSLSPQLKRKIDRLLPEWTGWSYVRQYHIRPLQAIVQLSGMGIATLFTSRLETIGLLFKNQRKNLMPLPPTWLERNAKWVQLAGFAMGCFMAYAWYSRPPTKEAACTFFTDKGATSLYCSQEQEEEEYCSDELVMRSDPKDPDKKIPLQVEVEDESGNFKWEYVYRRQCDHRSHEKCSLPPKVKAYLRALVPDANEELSNWSKKARHLAAKIRKEGGDTICLSSAIDYFRKVRLKEAVNK